MHELWHEDIYCKRLSTTVRCTGIYQHVEECQVSVLLEWYANEGRYANEHPNLDVNYLAQLIIICLMRRKVEERSEMKVLPQDDVLNVWWWENECVGCVFVCVWGRELLVFGAVCEPVLHQLVQWPRWGFLVNTAQYVVDKHCMQGWLLRGSLMRSSPPLSYNCNDTYSHNWTRL